ncbi:protein mab-21-like 3 [Mercenaria mercenaria]|uniref:protein mab-21-like 3 n=1 Tax=Mercenaria mercenaria TaxID=6596 RepID=UPI00234F80CC|nr:protein mab-21-like 3 [Mercenaria mercenaria]
MYDSNEGIDYSYVTNENSNMRHCRRLSTGFDVPIPNGCAVVEVQNIGNTQRFIHTAERKITVLKPVFRGYGFFTVPHYETVKTEINRNSDGKIEILPRDIKQDFHAKIRTAISDLRMHNVKLDENSHGPALTLTLSPDRKRGVHHNISVDLTVSLKCSLQLQEFNWPRSATLRAFDEELIERAIGAGIHLVPKKDLFWSISFSRAERALLSGIDADSGCRKKDP